MARADAGPPVASPDRRENSILRYRVAAMHFQDHLSNLDIARALGISRFRVARLIERAVESGAVDIRIDLPVHIDEDLSAQVRALGLEEVKVLDSERDPDPLRGGLAALALRHVSGLLREGDRLAVAWGRTLDAIVTAAANLQLTMPKVDVVQLVGGVSSPSGGLEASDLVRRFAALSGGAGIMLNAPLVAPTADVADGLRRESSVTRTLEAAAAAKVALFGVGSWSGSPSHLQELLSDRDRAWTAKRDVAGDACGLLVSSAGRVIKGGLSNRIVGIDAESLVGIPRRIAVVSGADRSSALHAVMRAGLVTDLILDRAAARGLLEADSA